jgi:serine/threonine protein kinase
MTAHKDYYALLEVDREADVPTIKAAYRRKAHGHHPDRGGNPADFAAVREALDVLTDPAKRTRYDRLGTAAPVQIRSKDHVYTVSGPVATGDLAELLAADDETGAPVVLKSLRDPANADLFANEAARLARLTVVNGSYSRYFTTLRESFPVRDSNRVRRDVHVFDRLDGWFTLLAVQAKQPRLQFEHAVWMFNRMLEALGHAHSLGIVHGAIVPAHVMVYATTDVDSEWDHGLKLLDWCYAVDVGKPITAIAPAWREFYPPEVFAKRAAGHSTDIYMAVKTIIYLLGGDVKTDAMPNSVPGYLQNFLRGCTLGNPACRPSDAWKLHRDFTAFMKANYGPRKYVRFTLPTN